MADDVVIVAQNKCHTTVFDSFLFSYAHSSAYRFTLSHLT
jgi:hypothetical protein